MQVCRGRGSETTSPSYPCKRGQDAPSLDKFFRKIKTGDILKYVHSCNQSITTILSMAKVILQSGAPEARGQRGQPSAQGWTDAVAPVTLVTVNFPSESSFVVYRKVYPISRET